MISETSVSTDFSQSPSSGGGLAAALRTDAVAGARSGVGPGAGVEAAGAAPSTRRATWSVRRKLAFFVGVCGLFWLLLGLGVMAVLSAI